MKKIAAVLILLVFGVIGYSQDTINYVWKRQPFKVSKIAHADTIFLSGESPYGSYGTTFVIDSTSDGRFYLKGGYSVDDSLTVLRSELADSTALLRSDISDTADVVRSELRSDIGDSTHFKLNSAGSYLEIESSAKDSMIIGANGGSKSDNVTLQVGGQFNQTPHLSTAADTVYNARNGNIILVDGSLSLKSINKAVSGSEFTFIVKSSSTFTIDPADFTAKSQTIKVPSGTPIAADDFDVVKIICEDVNQFRISSLSGDNQ